MKPNIYSNSMALVHTALYGDDASKRKIKLALSLLALFAIAAVTIPLIRQETLDNRLLQTISRGASTPTVSALLRQGANPNSGDPEEYDTPLFRALSQRYPNLKTIEALLNAGASVHPQGNALVSPIAMLAASQPNTPMTVPEYRSFLILLKKHGAGLDEEDSLGCTPLMRSVMSGNLASTQALLELGANPFIENKHGDEAYQLVQPFAPDTISKMDKLLTPYMTSTAAPAPKN